MTALEAAPSTSGVSLESVPRRDGLMVAIRGNADFRDKEQIQGFLLDTHARVQNLGLTEVTIDLRELLFMSSSCIKAFVTWLMRVQNLPVGEQYRIHFLSSPDIHWQRRSLTALSCVAAQLVSISEG